MQNTTDKEEMYKSQLDTLIRWAHHKMVNSKDKQKADNSRMDVGGVAGKGGWDQQHWNSQQKQNNRNATSYFMVDL